MTSLDVLGCSPVCAEVLAWSSHVPAVVPRPTITKELSSTIGVDTGRGALEAEAWLTRVLCTVGDTLLPWGAEPLVRPMLLSDREFASDHTAYKTCRVLEELHVGGVVIKVCEMEKRGGGGVWGGCRWWCVRERREDIVWCSEKEMISRFKIPKFWDHSCRVLEGWTSYLST